MYSKMIRLTVQGKEYFARKRNRFQFSLILLNGRNDAEYDYGSS